MKRILSFITLVFFVTASAQVQTISKSDYEKADFTNVTTLQNDLKNVRIVGLGESSHYMGETYVSKIKMVKYLHQHCGFDVIAIESPLYNLDVYYNEYIKTGKITASDFLVKGAISGVWKTDDMYELFDYIIETQKTDRPLIYTGFDASLFETTANELDKDYVHFVNRLNSETNSNIEVDSLFLKALHSSAKLCYYPKKVAPKDTLILHNKFQEIKTALSKLEKDQYYTYWAQITENVESVYRRGYPAPWYREEQMVRNVKFLANQQFPDKKIILWAATYHLLEDITKIKGYEKLPKKSTMGYSLREEFKDQYYVIGFVPATGVTGFKGYLGLAKFKAKAKKGSIERYILDKYNPDYAFISLRNPLSRKEISENKIERSNFIGTTSYKMDILSITDAFFYLKEEHLVSFEKEKAYLEKERETENTKNTKK
ncbi:erythromycin esterase family protein [Capnocytophaga canis]|uniref:erythromycin esterase family protein n=1 Tax=Capnocytophaga canis TaxID=1848903 RepID=UPI001561FCB0|nr:erythromycin esterase family protein [Capnocytophaga canis]